MSALSRTCMPPDDKAGFSCHASVQQAEALARRHNQCMLELEGREDGLRRGVRAMQEGQETLRVALDRIAVMDELAFLQGAAMTQRLLEDVQATARKLSENVEEEQERMARELARTRRQKGEEIVSFNRRWSNLAAGRGHIS
ncbi:hypothetical protein [Olsenella massiliensis]|uniref:hypothetical protein n=1 Tax=Olsenella massiliensis TaxID=1622075 RepID=UPI0011DE4FFA|nr:hypothetical protein [Olsenella massiliensis]